MAKTTIKGKVTAVGPVTQVGEKQTDIQYIIVFTPGYHDGFAKVGRDNNWCLQALGKKVKELQMTEVLVDKIVMVSCFLDSQYVEPKLEGQDGFYSVNLNIESFEVIK